MNEDLLSAGWYQICETLLAIRKGKEWDDASFEAYAKRRWALSKTRARLFCKFAIFAGMCREDRMRMPDSPDVVAPVLSLPQKSWLTAWQYCIDCNAPPITRTGIEATLERFGFILHKRLPQEVMDRMAAKRAGKSLSQIQDVDGVKRPGNEWTEGDVLRKAAILAEKADG